jgi:hypothetical protein
MQAAPPEERGAVLEPFLPDPVLSGERCSSAVKVSLRAGDKAAMWAALYSTPLVVYANYCTNGITGPPGSLSLLVDDRKQIIIVSTLSLHVVYVCRRRSMFPLTTHVIKCFPGTLFALVS